MNIIIDIFVEEKNKNYEVEVSNDLSIIKLIDSLIESLELGGNDYFLIRQLDNNILEDMKSLNDLKIFDGEKFLIKINQKLT